MLLKVEHEYELQSFRNKRSRARIQHELDYQFAHEGLALPRWHAIVIEPNSARAEPEARIDLGNPKIDIEVTLPPRRQEESIFVRTERTEIVHVPGSYNFYTNEFMKGFHLTIVNGPVGMMVEVLVRPHGGGEALHDQDHTWIYDQLISPGQGIEVKLKQAAGNEPTSRLTDAHPLTQIAPLPTRTA